MRKKIGVDFDDVIADHCEFTLELFNKKFDKSLVLSDLIDFNMENIIESVTREEVVNIHNESYVHTNRVLPVPGAIDAIKRLKSNYDLVMITGRPETASGYTHDWLSTHLPEVFSDTYFTNQFRGERKMGKAEFCKKNNIEILVDDYLGTAYECVKSGIKVLLYDRPWNQGNLPEGIIRMYSWGDIESYFSKIN